MPLTSLPEQAVAVIKSKNPSLSAKIGLVLGSGLNALAQAISPCTSFSYEDLPGFPSCSVEGHHGQLHIGNLNGAAVACLQGRVHYYESMYADDFKTPIRTLKQLGCNTIIITNASGSLRPEVTPGQLVLINDHINFQWHNPLAGIRNDDAFGSRFISMDQVYDQQLLKQSKQHAEKLNIPIAEGVYIGVLGPSFETPAEIRAFKSWGADVIGMSTLPEVILARHCNMKVLLVAAISNMASGISQVSLSHELTLQGAQLSLENLTRLITSLIHDLSVPHP